MRRITKGRIALSVLMLGTLASCQQNRSLYRWGNYEDSVWNVTHAEGAADLDAEIAAFGELIERSRQTDRPVAPGMHAHLGLLYSMKGQLDAAQAAFESERELYPESSAFIDGLIQRMGASQ
ncbi:MAG: DUF4810 domain-containing protein [Planctomycetota bacterium]